MDVGIRGYGSTSALSYNGEIAVIAQSDKVRVCRKVWSGSGFYYTDHCLIDSGKAGGSIESCAINDDGTRALVSFAGREPGAGTCNLWGNEWTLLDLGYREKHYTHQFDLSGDGSTAALACSSQSDLYIWHLGQSSSPRRLAHHQEKLKKCCLSYDGRIAISASLDGEVCLWDVLSEKPLCVLTHSDKEFLTCALSGDGRTAITTYENRQVKVWDVPSGGLRWELPDSESGSTLGKAALSWTGEIALIGGFFNAEIWNLNKKIRATSDLFDRKRTYENAYMQSTALSGDGLIVLACFDKRAWLWHIFEQGPDIEYSSSE